MTAPIYLGAGYYDPYYWDWGPGWGYPPFGPAFAGHGAGSARLKVMPKNAEVYVDGYLAGVVDDFDGFFQRLDVAAGEHELTFYLDGYRTVTQKVLFQPGTTLEIKAQLDRLAPGESSGPRPVAPEPPPPPDMSEGMPPDMPPGMPPPGPQTRRRGPDPRGGPVFREPAPDGAFGTLAIRIQPADATLLIDGEEWSAPEGDGPILIDLPEGPHVVEVRKDGQPPYRRTVQVRAGRTIPLNVSVSR